MRRTIADCFTRTPKRKSRRDLDGPIPRQDLTVITDAPTLRMAPRLSDEDVSSLAEQLAEAKHEEAQAEDEAASRWPKRLSKPPNSRSCRKRSIPNTTNMRTRPRKPTPSPTKCTTKPWPPKLLRNMAKITARRHSEGHSEDQAEALGEEEEHAGAHGEEHGEQMGEDHAAGDHAEETHAEFHGSAEPPQPGENRQPTSARISEQPRARFQRPMRRGGRPQRGGRRAWPPAPGAAARAPAPRAASPPAADFRNAEGRPGNHRPDRQGAAGQKGRAHHQPRRAARPLPGLHAHGQSHRRLAPHRLRRRALAPAPPGHRSQGHLPRRIHRAHRRRRRPRRRNPRRRRIPRPHLGQHSRQSEPRNAPSLLHRDLNLVERILRDYVSNDYAAIWIDNEEEFSKVVEFVSRFQPKLVSRVKLYTKPAPIFEEFGIQQELDKALRPKVWLKSGGYIVINHTEALVAIDVNTGKYVGRGSTRLEDTIVKTNLEAVKEIVRQIRLRDLGGIIVLDFIDMEERRNRDKVMAALDQALRSDRAPSKALSLQRIRPGLHHAQTHQAGPRARAVPAVPVLHRLGHGQVRFPPSATKSKPKRAKWPPIWTPPASPCASIRKSPRRSRRAKPSLIEELEQATRKSVIIQADPTLHWEQYDIY